LRWFLCIMKTKSVFLKRSSESINLKNALCLLLFILLLGFKTQAQEEDTIAVDLQPMVVTAVRMPVNALHVSRSLDIIDEQIIKNTGAESIEELLQKGANINIQPRGILGVQSDLSIRGASFSQQLILLNSVRLNDAQTAHHNFDLPISIDQIERIEVLKGSGSALYGPDAYGGVINIITKTPEQKTLWLKLSGGENGLVNASGCFDFSNSGIHSSNTIEHRRSDGYHTDTDFHITSITSNNTLEFPFGTYRILGGYTTKEFGAFNFYGPAPSKEWTETTLFNLSSEQAFSSFLLQPKVSYRRHYDKFLYDLRIPDKFVNVHTTQSYSGEIQLMIQVNESASLMTGVEGTVNDIVSTNLKNHRRTSIGILVSLHSILAKKYIFDAGAREDFHSEYGQQFNPTASMGYLFLRDAKVFITAGRSFRAPSYTELYYSSKSRIGNPGLHPETGWSYELGMDYNIYPHVQITASIFERNQRNLIDYVQFSAADTAYSAANFATASTRGVEIEYRWKNDNNTAQESRDHVALQHILVSYTYLDSHIDLGNIYSTLYSFTHPRHQLSMVITGLLPFTVSSTVSATHKIKLDGTNYTLVDATFIRPISLFEVSLQGTNLLNQSYEEIRGIPLPGRWLWAGIKFKIL
jgi:vitamin B12 transporter